MPELPENDLPKNQEEDGAHPAAAILARVPLPPIAPESSTWLGKDLRKTDPADIF